MADFVDKNARETINKYINSHGIKKSYLASKMGLTQQNLSYYLNGNGKISVEFVLLISKVLEISPDLFLSKSYKKLVEK